MPEEPENGADAKARAGLVGQAADNEVGCMCRAEEHRVSATLWTAVGYVLLVIATVGAGVGASELATDKEGALVDAAPWFALAAAIAAGLSTALNPLGKAAAHHAAHEGYSSLVQALRTFRESSSQVGSLSDVRAAWDAVQAQGRTLQTTPATGRLANRAATKKDQRCAR